MKTQTYRHFFTRWLFVLLAVFSLAACATGPEVVDHGFGFSMFTDGQDAELIDYRYGDSRHPGASNPELMRQEGKSDQQSGVRGEMRRGDSLYAKWRNKSSGQVYEDTVDLRHRLPADIKGDEIYFMIRGSQLYVYLITPQKRAKDEPPNGPEMYDYRKTLTIYPDQVKR